MNNTLRLIAHAILGASLGFFTSVIFLLLYYGTTYTLPVTDALRFRNAFWGAAMLSCAILVVMFWHDIRVFLDKYSPADEDEDETE